MTNTLNRSIFVRLILLILFLTCAVSVGFASVPKPADIVVTSAKNKFSAGTPVQLSIDLTFHQSAHNATLFIRSNGIVDDISQDMFFGGGWKRDDLIKRYISFNTSGSGSGEIDFILEAYDNEGNTLFERATTFHVLSDGSTKWVSHSSLTDTRITRLLDLTRSKSSVRQKTGDELELPETMDDIITSIVEADDTEYEELPLSTEQQLIQEQFNTVVVTEAAKSKVSARATVNITVKGKVQWTDSEGKKHPLPLADVEIYDEDVILDDLITTTKTDAAGNYSVSFAFDDGIGAGNPDIYVKVYARSAVADLKPHTSSGKTYNLQSTTVDEVADGSTETINLTASGSSDGQTVFSVHHALVVIGAYAGNIAGVMPSQIVVRFPTTKHTSLFDGTELHILQKDRWDWDVIHHEYGHYFMRVHSIQSNPGGRHGFSDNLANTTPGTGHPIRGKDKGIRLAWGEGWPTYFGTVGQAVMGASSLGIKNVGDTRYTDTEDSSNNIDLETSNGVGEDNEVSVMAALWDLYDSAEDGMDTKSISDKTLFTTIKSAAAKNIGNAWEAVAATQDTFNKTVVGGILGQAKIAPELLEPADNIQLSGEDRPPKFKWKKNGGGTPNPLNEFTIKFYNSDFSTVIFEKVLGDVDEFRPTNDEMATILAGDNLIKWVVEGKNTSAPSTSGGALGYYWSAARTIGGISIAFVIDDTGSMGEEIGSVKNALVSYIDAVDASLGEGDKTPTIQLITFKDSVTIRNTSNDLSTVRSAVNALSASGGGDCPEFSAQALDVASRNISPGGTILFATDASSQPGVDIGAVISRLRTKGVTLNTILSADCGPIPSSKPGYQRALNDNSDDLEQSGYQAPTKPGGDDETLPAGDIVDAGQPVIDDYGDSQGSASLLPLGTGGIRGSIGADPDVDDFFIVPLKADTIYSIKWALESGDGNTVTFKLLDSAGTTITTDTISTATEETFVHTPTADDDFIIQVSRASSTVVSSYLIKVYEDAFATLTSAVEMFSTMSSQTGGAFIVRDSVNSGSADAYESAVLNIMKSTIGPTVLFSTPESIPQNAMLNITLHGENTSWLTNKTNVTFAGDGITVNSVTVLSPTLLDVFVDVAAGATLGFRDVQVVTDLGASTETVDGSNIVEVIPAILTPEILSVESSVVSQNTVDKLVVRGINTNWDNTTTVAFSAGITVTNVAVASPTLMEVDVSIDNSAAIGYRTATVTTGADVETMSRAVFVQTGAVAFAHIDTVTPSIVKQSQTVNFSVTGAMTGFEQNITHASLGAGVRVLSVNVIDDTTATVKVLIDKRATPGFRNVTVTTASESAVLLNGFLIQAAPNSDSAKAIGIGEPPEETPLFEKKKTTTTFILSFDNFTLVLLTIIAGFGLFTRRKTK